ncbi:peroxiredoxin [Rubrimonas cliftonensis]|uniref:Glutathione-dependent peroxiredoxin n=1 Tax=Rubrimonas cliftonensis TaxID=89524 RepID=A0A1H4DTL5_9RHOB|nr:peroxiredoxin [Rubrimonas cliftonensis]SEA75946.1 Peroxiredoxin [Rubrimonas cliftonensis]
MTITAGDTLPAATFKTFSSEGIRDVPGAELFGSGRTVLFAVPGAYTPTCSERHMPGFVANVAQLKAKGVDRIVCVSVNDPFVMNAWGKATGATEAGVLLVADPEAAFTRALGLEFDGSGAGLGVRSKRYAMVVENGAVSSVAVEDSPGDAERSTAEAVLATL